MVQGQKKLTEFGDDLAAAKEMFTQKFYDKTLNPFEERKEFVKVHGKYDLVQVGTLLLDLPSKHWVPD